MHSHGGKVTALREVFASYPPIMAAISFDGTPEVHDAFRGKVGSFDNAVRAMRTLKEIGVATVGDRRKLLAAAGAWVATR